MPETGQRCDESATLLTAGFAKSGRHFARLQMTKVGSPAAEIADGQLLGSENCMLNGRQGSIL